MSAGCEARKRRRWSHGRCGLPPKSQPAHRPRVPVPGLGPHNRRPTCIGRPPRRVSPAPANASRRCERRCDMFLSKPVQRRHAPPPWGTQPCTDPYPIPQERASDCAGSSGRRLYLEARTKVTQKQPPHGRSRPAGRTRRYEVARSASGPAGRGAHRLNTAVAAVAAGRPSVESVVRLAYVLSRVCLGQRWCPSGRLRAGSTLRWASPPPYASTDQGWEGVPFLAWAEAPASRVRSCARSDRHRWCVPCLSRMISALTTEIAILGKCLSCHIKAGFASAGAAIQSTRH